jgi:ribosome-associated protein
MAKSERRPKTPSLPRLPADVKIAIQAMLDKKATDIVVLDFRKADAFTDFFVIATGGNVRQVQAISDGVEEALRAKYRKPTLTEGYERGQWILADYFDLIVHVFSPSTREFYGLERLWADAKRIDIPADPA